VLLLVLVIDGFKNEEFEHEHEKREFRNGKGVDLAIHSFSSLSYGFSLAFALRN